MPTGSNTYTTAGSNSWVCPAGVFWATVECWGAGGAGAYMSANGNGGGGGGGAYAKKYNIPVVPGTTYTMVIGTGGNNQNNANGTASSFNNGSANVCVGTFGITAPRNNTVGQLGGLNNSCVGDVLKDGGNGNSGPTSLGGAGGASPSSWSNGVNASGQGTTVALENGGNGGAGSTTGNGNGTNGVQPGGGGGGGARTSGNHRGGNGGAGKIVVWWERAQTNNHLFVKASSTNPGTISVGERIR